MDASAGRRGKCRGRRLGLWTRWGRFCRRRWDKHPGLGPTIHRRCSSPFLGGLRNDSASFFLFASTIPLTTNSFLGDGTSDLLATGPVITWAAPLPENPEPVGGSARRSGPLVMDARVLALQSTPVAPERGATLP